MLETKKKLYELKKLSAFFGDKDDVFKKIIETAHAYLLDKNIINEEISRRYFFSSNNNLRRFKKSNHLTIISDELRNFYDSMNFDDFKDMITSIISESALFYKGPYVGNVNFQLNELAYKLLDLGCGGGDVLYNPNCGVGDSLITIFELNKKKKVILKELICSDENEDACYLTSLIADIFSDGKSMTMVVDEKEHLHPIYNKLFVRPTFHVNSKLFSKDNDSTHLFEDIHIKSIINSEWYLIDKYLNFDYQTSRGVILVSGKALSDTRSATYRQKIIESGYLEGIIALPPKVIPFCLIPTYLLVFSCGNKNIKFLDATDMIIKNKSRFSEREMIVKLDLSSILDKYSNESVIKDISEVSMLKNLNPSVVSVKKPKFEQSQPLRKLAEVFSGNQYTLKNFQGMIEEKRTGYSILTSNDITDYQINVDSLTHIRYEDTKFDKYCIKYGDVVVTSKSSKVKVGVVDFEPKEKIIVTGSMIIIRPFKDKLDPFYLKTFLDSSAGKISLDEIKKGSVISSINASDLSEIRIPVVDLEKQKHIANKYKKDLTTLIAYKREVEELEIKLKKVFEEEIGGVN